MIFNKVKNIDKIIDFEKFKNLIIEREQIVTTAIGLGFAIPHVKNNSIKDFFISIFILETSINWNSIDGEPVKVVFLIGGPENHKQYLQILSKLILIIRNRELSFSLKNSKDLEFIYKLLNNY